MASRLWLIVGACVGVSACAMEADSTTGRADQASRATFYPNDVSVLYPMELGAERVLLRPTSKWNGTKRVEAAATDPKALLPKAVYDGLLNDARFSDDSDHEPVSENHYVVSVRLDPCSKERPGSGCQPQIRFVLQELNIWPDRIPDAYWQAGVHLFYDVSRDTFVQLLQEIVALKADRVAGGDTSSELGPHPLMARDFKAGRYGADTFAPRFANALLKAIANGTLTGAGRQTNSGNTSLWEDGVRAQNLRNLGGCALPGGAATYGWTFRAGSVKGYGASTLTDVGTQIVFGRGDSIEEDAYGTFCPARPNEVDSVEKFNETATMTVSAGNGATFEMENPAAWDDPEQALAAYTKAIKVQNPSIHFRGETSCVNCHLSEGIRLSAKKYLLSRGRASDVATIEDLYWFKDSAGRKVPSSRFAGGDFLRAFGYGPSASAGGYEPGVPVIMQRVVNDSYVSAEQAAGLLTSAGRKQASR